MTDSEKLDLLLLKMENMDNTIYSMKSDIDSMKKDMVEMKSDISVLKSDVSSIKVKIEETNWYFENEINGLKIVK